MIKLTHHFIRGLAIAALSGAAIAQQAVDIGSRLELFVDKHLVEKVEGLELRLHAPTPLPTPQSPMPKSHMVSVLQDGDIFRAWFRGFDLSFEGNMASGNPAESVFYARSTDGHEWTFPDLGIVDVPGNDHGNAILTNMPPFLHNFMIFLDTREGVPASERYKAVAGHPGPIEVRRDAPPGIGLHGFVSPDGFEWTNIGEIIPFRQGWRHAFDSPNVAFWSEAEQLYVCYFRTWIEPRGPRAISRSTSPDFINWSEPVQLAVNFPGEHFYTSMTHPYVRAPHIYIALPTRFVPMARDSAQEVLPNRTDVLFMTARAGSETYDRLFTEAFIRPGLDPTRWGNRENFVASQVLQTAPHELSIYHRSGDRFVIRTDGFVSAHAGASEGSLLTKPIIYDGTRLEINFSTSAVGFVQVEILNENGATVAKSNPLAGDAIDHPVEWPDAGIVAQWAGKPVQLRFHLKEADLYSYGFKH